MKISYKDIAAKLKEKADLDLTDKEARDFVNESLVNTMHIIRRSKGKIQVKNCDVQQFYKDIPWEDLENRAKDLNEVETVQNKIRIY